MNKYQILEVTKQSNNAGSKAVQDVSSIASEMGFKTICIRMKCPENTNVTGKVQRQIQYYYDWNKAYKEIEKDSIVLLQNPFHHKQLTREKILKKLKEEKNVKFISLIHDVEKLRKSLFNDYYAREFQTMLELSSVFIIHNEKMKEYFKSLNIDENRLINLEIFDYLQNSSEGISPLFKKQITIAGNLDVNKCAYIKELTRLEELEIQLYGPNYNNDLLGKENIHYGGSIPSDKLPNLLNEGFGLIWDGTSIEDCKGDYGQYLKFNNPHKLSLYLSSGLPVVIWSQAAEADFVVNNHVGICVDSLLELKEKFNEINEDTYKEYVQNCSELSKRFQRGYYTKKALALAEKAI